LREKKISCRFIAQREKAKHRNVVSWCWRSLSTRRLWCFRGSRSAGPCREERSKICRRDAEPRGCFVYHLPAHERIVHPRDGLGQSARELQFRAQRAHVRRPHFPLNPIIKKILRTRDAALEFLFPLSTNQRIGIFATRQLHYANDQIILQQCIKR